MCEGGRSSRGRLPLQLAQPFGSPSRPDRTLNPAGSWTFGGPTAESTGLRLSGALRGTAPAMAAGVAAVGVVELPGAQRCLQATDFTAGVDTLMITGLVPVLLPRQLPLGADDLRDPGTCNRPAFCHADATRSAARSTRTAAIARPPTSPSQVPAPELCPTTFTRRPDPARTRVVSLARVSGSPAPESLARTTGLSGGRIPQHHRQSCGSRAHLPRDDLPIPRVRVVYDFSHRKRWPPGGIRPSFRGVAGSGHHDSCPNRSNVARVSMASISRKGS